MGIAFAWLSRPLPDGIRLCVAAIPELIDDECLAAFDHVEAQYCDVQSFVAGLEVRLGSPQRYADYTLYAFDDSLFPGAVVWLEMDYQAFCGQGDIVPCLFVNTWESADADDPESYWSRLLAAFAGEDRASRLRRGFDDILKGLPRGVCVKQVGSMARPGEADSLRVVLMFWNLELTGKTMAAIGWPGDASALTEALAPYWDMDRMGIGIDLDASGIRDKTGIEIFPRWVHPVLVDRMVSRLERAGLCLPEKGRALRRWVRIPPDEDPFIQTVISHYKLNYEDGAITEAKAYLQQNPYPLHRFYPKDQA